MSTIRIWSKKAFAIGPGARKGTDVIENFITVPNTFQDMPDKYSSDKTFIAAVNAHEIEVINVPVSAPVSSVAPVESVQDETEDGFTDETVDPVAEYKEKIKVMNRDEVKEEAEKYGAEFINEDSLKMNKKRLFEAYKLSLQDK